LFDRRESQSGPISNRTANSSLCEGEKNHSGSLPISASNRPSDKGNSWSGPPAAVNIPPSVAFQAGLEGVHQHSNKPTQKLPASGIGHQNVNNVTQHPSGAPSYPSTENRNANGKSGLFESRPISEATRLEDPQLENDSNIAEAPASLANSQPDLRVNQQSSLFRSQQRWMSCIVTAQPELSNTPVGAVQASGNTSCVPGSSTQATGISSAGHSAETLHLHVSEPPSTNHVTLSAAVSETPEKAVPDQNTNSTLMTEIQQETSGTPTLRTYSTRTSDRDPRNQAVGVEVVDFRNDSQLETESECLGTDVISKQSEEQEITILTVEDCVSKSNSESSKTTTASNKIPAAMLEEAGGSDSEVEVVSSRLLSILTYL
jgi:hypothetical protein